MSNAGSCFNCTVSCGPGYQLDGACTNVTTPTCVPSSCMCAYPNTDVTTGSSSLLCPNPAMSFVQNGVCTSQCLNSALNSDLTAVAPFYRSYNPITNISNGYIAYPNCSSKNWCSPTNCVQYAPNDCSTCVACVQNGTLAGSYELAAINTFTPSYRPCMVAARPYFEQCLEVVYNLGITETIPVKVVWPVIAVDDESGVQIFACSDSRTGRALNASSLYSLDPVPVTCSIQDWYNYTTLSNCSFFVRVKDVTPPVIDCPSTPFYKSLPDGQTTGEFNWAVPNATDFIDGFLNASYITCDRNISNTTFPFGYTRISCRASDFSNNVATCLLQVFFQSLSAPNITCSPNINVNLSGYVTQPVTYLVSAVDPANPALLPLVVCSPISGGQFVIGRTLVICTATSQVSYQATQCSFDVIVSDVTPPTVNCQTSVSANTDPGSDMAVVSLQGFVFDNSGISPLLTCVPATNTQFPLGNTSTVCTAIDLSGNKGTCTFPVVVSDREFPSILWYFFYCVVFSFIKFFFLRLLIVLS